MKDKKGGLALASVLAFGLATGLCGIRWGLPGQERLRAFPERLLPTPEVAQEFARHWARLYDDLRRSHAEMRSEEPVTYAKGVEEIAPGWSFPPDKLLNCYRALLLQSENPDEKKSFIILSQMRPWRFEFKPLYAVYPGAYIYPLGAFLKLLSWFGALTLIPDMSYYLQNPEEMGRLYLGGRLFILLFHLGSLWVLYDIGCRLRGVLTGFYAALFFSLCPLVVVNSHVLKPHPCAVFWALASLRSMLMAFQDGKSRDYRLCGLFGGMAFGANFSLAYFAGMPAMAWLGRSRLAGARGELKQALGGCAIAAGLFVATNPYFVFANREYIWEMQQQSHGYGLRISSLLTVLGKLATNGMGSILCAISCLGMLAAIKRNDRTSRFLAGSFLASFAALWIMLSLFAAPFVATTHYYYPMLGWACLFAADVISGLPKRLLALALSAVLIDSGLGSWVYLKNMRLDASPRSTRQEAASWIESHIPEGTSIGLSRYPEPAHTPPFRYDRYRLVVFERAELLKALPEYMVVDSQGKAAVESLPGYDLVQDFLPARALWARVGDDIFFANAPMYIYRRRLP